MVDGKTDVFAKVRTKHKAMAEIVAAFSRDIESKGLVDVVAHHIDDEDEGRQIAVMAAEAASREVPVVPVGLVYVTEKPMEKRSR